MAELRTEQIQWTNIKCSEFDEYFNATLKLPESSAFFSNHITACVLNWLEYFHLVCHFAFDFVLGTSQMQQVERNCSAFFIDLITTIGVRASKKKVIE